MLHVFYGNDVVSVRTAAYAFIHGAEEPDMVVEHLLPEEYVSGVLIDYAGSQSLFGGKRIVIIDTPSEKPLMFEDVILSLELLSKSTTGFVLIENSLLATEKRKIEKFAEECVEKTAVKAERFNAFLLADALSVRDKKVLWTLLIEAKEKGLTDEEILGTLYWQVKMLRLAERTKSPEEAGQKPFVYNKAKRALMKFKKGELDELSRMLLSIYHDGHLGKRDIDIALEKLVLKL